MPAVSANRSARSDLLKRLDAAEKKLTKAATHHAAEVQDIRAQYAGKSEPAAAKTKSGVKKK
ncbi:hypothetical protein RFD81_004806 [Klebsiella aerogenes]|nr:hypothetical protein [Klebsiella aerogenes]